MAERCRSIPSLRTNEWIAEQKLYPSTGKSMGQ